MLTFLICIAIIAFVVFLFMKNGGNVGDSVVSRRNVQRVKEENVNDYQDANRPNADVDSELVLDCGNGVKLELMKIPAGKFMMGAGSLDQKEDTDSSECPQHEVRLKEFYIGEYAVTKAQYQAVTGENPSEFTGDTLPVDSVSWVDAKEFCRRLSRKIDKQVRLPSEAEWEYACRAGTTTPFTYGDGVTTAQVNYCGSFAYWSSTPEGEFRGTTVPVHNFKPNRWGLYQMLGNVWEWCEDIRHDDYNGAPADGSAWIINGKEHYRVCRGGSWQTLGKYGRSACRNFSDSSGSSQEGFRIVVSPPQLNLMEEKKYEFVN